MMKKPREINERSNLQNFVSFGNSRGGLDYFDAEWQMNNGWLAFQILKFQTFELITPRTHLDSSRWWVPRDCRVALWLRRLLLHHHEVQRLLLLVQLLSSQDSVHQDACSGWSAWELQEERKTRRRRRCYWRRGSCGGVTKKALSWRRNDWERRSGRRLLLKCRGGSDERRRIREEHRRRRRAEQFHWCRGGCLKQSTRSHMYEWYWQKMIRRVKQECTVHTWCSSGNGKWGRDRRGRANHLNIH